jgi:chemotaxis protein MotB
MKKTGRFVALFVAIAFAAGCASTTRLKAENSQLKDQVQRLSEALAASDSEKQRLADRNAELEDSLGRASADVVAKDSELEEMREKLAGKGFDVTVTGGMVVVNLPTQILYASGSAVITSTGKDRLRSLASELKGDFADFKVEIQGHTDTDPIRRTKDKYKSNWELSYARGQAVAYYLMESAGIKPDRVHVSAYGEHTPIASNASADGKAKNRRVQVVVMK